MRIWGKIDQRMVLVFILLAASILYFASLDPNKFGFHHDDGIYVVSAKSMAEGSGYRIQSLPGEPPQTKYPPFYPFILSIVWRLFPRYPANISALFMPSILATLGSLILARQYFVQHLSATRGTALLAITLIAFNTRTLILAASTLSEALYTFFSIWAILATESHLKKPQLRDAIFATVALSIAILTRTAGISLLISVLVLALFRRKLLRAAPIIMIGGFLFLAWIAWARIHIADGVNAATMFYVSYFGDLREIFEFSEYFALVARNAFMLIPMSIPIVCLGVGFDFVLRIHNQLVLPAVLLFLLTFGFILSGFIRSLRESFGLSHVYIIGYLAIHIIWPYSSFDRFLMPLLPFFAFYLIKELSVQIASLRSLQERARYRKLPFALIPMSAGIVFVFLVYGNLVGICNEAMPSRNKYASIASLDDRLADWIRRNTQPSDIVLGYPDPRYYLNTGRKSITVAMSIKGEQSDPHSLVRQIRETGCKYIIYHYERVDAMDRALKSLLRANPEEFLLTFSCEGGAIYRVGNPSS